MIRAEITVKGIVQGVGFRPFIYRLALAHQLTGTVANTPAGVSILVHGPEEVIDLFARAVQADLPPLAVIHDFKIVKSVPAEDLQPHFVITESVSQGREIGPVTPDTDVCRHCLAELFDPEDRRYLYPFINCTDCGPRYSLIAETPYDRPKTAMQDFALCARCLAEYRDPLDRRFHAQATCCPDCGPALSLVDGQGRPVADPDPVGAAVKLIEAGEIVALKGLGGFHLAVDAGNPAAVAELRARKGRPAKPLAVMAAGLAAVRTFALADPDEEARLQDPMKPIVLLVKQEPFCLAENVAPANRYIGVMLPYTPLHYLIFRHAPGTVLVMTSGNLSGSPIVRDNDEALAKLAGIADYFLLHNRPIITRIDDSVVRVDRGATNIFRRARSYVPIAVRLAMDAGRTLALGAMIKNTVCLTNGREAFVSQHIGDLDNVHTQPEQEVIVRHLQKLLRIEPDLLVHDLHPDYPSTRYALTQQHYPVVGVQHHHGHAVACMAEHGLTGPVIALALDGTGYGLDNTVWGGEVLVACHDSFERAAHLEQVPMPGGEAAVHEPWRMAVSHLHNAYGHDFVRECRLPVLKQYRRQSGTIIAMIEKRLNSPLTSSCGRLFDTIAALLDLRYIVSYEGQAAAELEMLIKRSDKGIYPLAIDQPDSGPWLLPTAPVIRAVVDDLLAGKPLALISARFHNTMAALFTEVAGQLREKTGINQVVMSGGVFQNMTLLRTLSDNLVEQNFEVFAHRQVPANDGGLSLGQAVAGRAIHKKASEPRHRICTDSGQPA